MPKPLEQITARAITPIDDDAFTKALASLFGTYRRAYSEGSRNAIDQDDRAQAHHEALTEALEAALLTYLETAR